MNLKKVHPHYNWHYKDCLTQAQVVTEGINTSTALENSYNLMQSFIQAVETGNTHEQYSWAKIINQLPRSNWDFNAQNTIDL